MASNPRNQAELSRYARAREQELVKKAFEEESEIVEFLNWAELPMTKKVRQKFKEQEKKIIERLKSNKWSELEGKALCSLLDALGIIEKMVESCKKLYHRIQVKKQKEG